MSSVGDPKEQNVLYKVFIRKGASSVSISESKLTEMFGLIAEPFKVYVDHQGWALAFFASRADARACIAAFNRQPPFNYEITQARDEVHIMAPKEIREMHEKLKYQAKKLRQIQMQMKELKLEEARLKNKLRGRNFDDESDSSLSNDDCESVTNGNIHSSLSGSRISLANNHDSRSMSQRKDNNRNGFRQGNSSRHSTGGIRNCQGNESHPFEDAQKTFSHNVPEREYKNVQQNRPLRNSEAFGEHHHRSQTPNRRNSDFRGQQQRSQTPNRRDSHNHIKGSTYQNRDSNNCNGGSENYHETQTKQESITNRESLSGHNHNELHKNRQSSFFDDQPTGILKSSNNKKSSTDESSKVEAVVPMNITPRKCIVELFKTGQSGVLKLKNFANSEAIAQIDVAGSFLEVVEIIRNLWESYSENDAIVPKIGELVCVENEDTWCRGYIVEKLDAEWKVALIDEGIFVSATKPCKLLEDHKSVPEFACSGHVNKILMDKNQFKQQFLPSKSFGFTVTSIEGTDVVCTLKDRKTKTEICEIRLFRWVPIILNSSPKDPSKSTTLKSNPRIPEPDIPSGSLVMISYVISQNSLFLRYRQTANILQNVGSCMAEGNNFNGPSSGKAGDCVAAKFQDDGKWYRAVILSADANSFVVSFVDYGNREKVTLKEIKELPPAMLEIPKALLNVKLSNVPKAPLTLEQAKYFEACSENGIKYKIEYDDNGVTLTNKNTNQILNDEILKVTKERRTISSPPNIVSKSEVIRSKTPDVPIQTVNKPSKLAKQEAKPSKPIEIESQPSKTIENETKPSEPAQNEAVDEDIIKSEELSLGKTQLIFQNVMDNDERIIICYKNDLEALTYTQVKLTEEIGDYVNSSNEPPFTPSIGKSCLALFDGDWYRALCLNCEDGEATVMFVDFGNFETVSVNHIRKLPKKFSTTKSAAIICTVSGVPEALTGEEFKGLFKELETYEAEVIAKDADEQYIIKMPHIA